LARRLADIVEVVRHIEVVELVETRSYMVKVKMVEPVEKR
jgi:hypothetical protein